MWKGGLGSHSLARLISPVTTEAGERRGGQAGAGQQGAQFEG